MKKHQALYVSQSGKNVLSKSLNISNITVYIFKNKQSKFTLSIEPLCMYKSKV